MSMNYYGGDRRINSGGEVKLPFITTLSDHVKVVSTTGDKTGMTNLLHFSNNISLPLALLTT